MPEIGEHRFVLASLLAFFIAPAIFLASLKFNSEKSASIDPFIDLATILLIVNFLPDLWSIALLLGIVVAQAPSLSIGDKSHRRFFLSTSMLLLGMGITGYIHQIEGWQLSLFVLAAVYPAMILYAYVQDLRVKEIRRKADSLSALQLLSSGVAHDFNNILTGIEGYAQQAKSVGFEPKSTEKAFQKIVEAARRASLLTQQLMSFSREGREQRELVDLGKEIKSLADMLRSSIGAGLRIDIELPRAPVQITGDPVHLNQVLLNLMVNAIEASKSPGKVTVSLSALDDQIQIEVADEGKGISPQFRTEMFQPFVTSKSDGHGLGLAVVKNIVEEHAGTIDVVSNVGLGSRFIVRLPIGAATTDPEADNQGKTSILIADDEMPIRVILRQVLEMEGFNVIEAEDGNRFLELFKNHEAELRAIVLDIKMPGKTGWQCLDVVRKTSPRLPALVVSGFDPEDRMDVEPDPGMRFLAKPFRIAEMKSMLYELLNSPTNAVRESSRVD